MKKILLTLTAVFMLISLVSCNKDSHVHKYDDGVVTTDSLCGGNKTVKYSCTECEHTYSKTYKVEHNWVKATCTAPKTCTICNETEGEELGHSYEENKCERCDSIVSITLTTPNITSETPIEVKNYLNGELTSKFNITALEYEYTASVDDNVKITVTVSAEKTYDKVSNDVSSACVLVYKVYDENGCVVTSGTYTTPYLMVGDKIADKNFTISGLNNGQTYTLVITDYYTTK